MLFPPPARPGRLELYQGLLAITEQPRQHYSYNLSVPTNDNQVVTKIDHSITNANRIFIRYFWDDNYNIQNTVVPAFNSQNDWVTHNGTINDTHIFSPTAGKQRRAHDCA